MFSGNRQRWSRARTRLAPATKSDRSWPRRTPMKSQTCRYCQTSLNGYAWWPGMHAVPGDIRLQEYLSLARILCELYALLSPLSFRESVTHHPHAWQHLLACFGRLGVLLINAHLSITFTLHLFCFRRSSAAVPVTSSGSWWPSIGPVFLGVHLTVLSCL